MAPRFLTALVSGVFVVSLGLLSPAAAQTGSIAGTVRDATTSAPLAGVTVTATGTHLAAQTNADGRYTMPAVPPGSYRLRARMLGYAPGDTLVQVQEGQPTTVDLLLQRSAVELNPVVAVGYGEQEKVNLTGSVATTSGTELGKRPVADGTDALQGVVPGLTVIDRGGRPGDAGTMFYIRGRGTLNNTDPLVLIDGVRADNTKLNALDPSDIENISVLKDAASAAIYGARAANGVILVTTKRGGLLGNLQVSYNNYAGMQSVADFPERVGIKDYLQLVNEAFVNAGLPPKYSQGYIDTTLMADRGVPGVDRYRYPDTYWLDVLWNPAPIQDHTVRVSGGTDLASFAASVNYLDKQGMMPTTAASRYGLRLNTDFRPSRRFQTGVDVALSRTWDLEPNDMGEALFRMFHDTPPVIVPKYPDGTYGWSDNNRNPLAAAEASGRHTREDLRGSITAKADYQLFPRLVVRTVGSVQARAFRDENWRNYVVFRDYYNPAIIRRSYSPNQLSQESQREVETYLRGLAEYKATIGEHAVSAMVGYEQTANDWSQTGARRQNFYNNDVEEINAGDASFDDNWGTSAEWRLRSGFGRLNYMWREKYLFEVNGRYDGSSRFAKGHRFGFFPSFSAGWRLSQEPFMRNVGIVSELKLRGSWGRTGNNAMPNNNNYPYWSLINLGQGYSLGDQLAPGAAQTTFANRDITWETTTMTDVGVDAELFGGRLTFTGDVYRKQTNGILWTLSIPWLVGLNPSVLNAAKVRNTGWEASLTYRAGAGDLQYSLGLNLSRNANMVTSLPGGPYFDDIFIRQAGLPIGTIYGLQADGLFRDSAEVRAHAFQDPKTGPGDIRFVDQNGDGIINEKDRIPIGNDVPVYTFGSSWTATYKGFDASVFWQGALDVDAYLEGALTEGPVWENYTTTEWLDHWTPTNLDAKMPKPTRFLHINHGPRSSFWVRDASYLKLKNAQIGYTLPVRLAQRFRLSRARIYVSGQNLLTFSKVTFLLDPEFPSGRATVYPQTRTFAVGTSVQF